VLEYLFDHLFILYKTNDAHLTLALRTCQGINFTNGCFDILHLGHLRYLQTAKSLGDILFIGLNSDASVKTMKEPSRPIIPEDECAEMLLGLRCVDYVSIFNEDTLLELIKMINPDFLVKGGDWDIQSIVGSDFVLKNGGDVRSIQFEDGHSTTHIINKIKEMNN
jgi:rfaE bifunctional protein nucleotidyltransferase chain/domain